MHLVHDDKNKRCLMCDDSNWKLLCQTCVSNVVMQNIFWIHQHVRIVLGATCEGYRSNCERADSRIDRKHIARHIFLRYDFLFDDSGCDTHSHFGKWQELIFYVEWYTLSSQRKFPYSYALLQLQSIDWIKNLIRP